MDLSLPLADVLANLKAASKARAAPERILMIERAIARLREESGVVDRALREGQLAPDTALPDVGGHRIRLRDIWRDGPSWS